MPSESIAFFEGRYMPVKEAKISIVDPAVTKSDRIRRRVGHRPSLLLNSTITSSALRLPAGKYASSCR